MVIDLSHFLIAHINDGIYNGVRILSKDSIDEMHKIQYYGNNRYNFDYGLGWQIWKRGGKTYIGHTGGLYGVATKMVFRKSDNVGIIYFMNRGVDGVKEWIAVAGDSFNDSEFGTDYMEGEITAEKSISYMENFYITRIYAGLGNLSTGNIINEVSKGAGFIDFEGHGNYLSWATHPIHNYNTWIGISVSDMPQMKNYNKPAIIISAAAIQARLVCPMSASAIVL